MLGRHPRWRTPRLVVVLSLAHLAMMAWTGIASAQEPPTPAQPPAQPAPPGQPPADRQLMPAAPLQNMEQPKEPPADRKKPDTEAQPIKANHEVFSDDWFGRARPILELHGYFRTRGELFHNFTLGRVNEPGDRHALWPQPLDNSYNEPGGSHFVNLCGDRANEVCQDKSQSMANMRLRLNPELHISDNLRVMSQIDALDNLVLGSTPESYAMRPGAGSAENPAPLGYQTAGYNPYAPLAAFSTTQGPPTAGVNGYRNSIDVKRVWAEYQTPFGQLRFGRMANHWGLGMLVNGGDHIDSDYQATADRIMFLTGIKSIDLYFGGMWDFPSTGPTSASPYDVYGGQPYNRANLTNVDQWGAVVVHRTNPELKKLKLANGDLVLNGGLFAVFRKQHLDIKAGQSPFSVDYDSSNNGLERRGGRAFIPDFWVQAMWRKLKFEGEFATIFGEIESSPVSADVTRPIKIRQYGLATQTEFRAVEDKLRIGFGFGWASGDPEVDSLNPQGIQPRRGPGPISTFRFHPDYRVDMIFWRRIMTRVQGAYYFRPSVEYDFTRNANGQKFGGGAAIIWSRASEFVQTPGHKRDLGVELNLSLYYQAKDGSLNDDPDKQGGFFSMLQYGVFFPLGGLEYLEGQKTNGDYYKGELSTAHTVRLFLGVLF